MFEGRKNLDYTGKHKKGKGIFWIYGDSLSFYFYESFSKTQREFCDTHFKMCNVSYNWIYPKTLYELVSFCPKFCWKLLEVERIRAAIRTLHPQHLSTYIVKNRIAS